MPSIIFYSTVVGIGLAEVVCSRSGRACGNFHRFTTTIISHPSYSMKGTAFSSPIIVCRNPHCSNCCCIYISWICPDHGGGGDDGGWCSYLSLQQTRYDIQHFLITLLIRSILCHRKHISMLLTLKNVQDCLCNLC